MSEEMVYVRLAYGDRWGEIRNQWPTVSRRPEPGPVVAGLEEDLPVPVGVGYRTPWEAVVRARNGNASAVVAGIRVRNPEFQEGLAYATWRRVEWLADVDSLLREFLAWMVNEGVREMDAAGWAVAPEVRGWLARHPEKLLGPKQSLAEALFDLAVASFASERRDYQPDTVWLAFHKIPDPFPRTPEASARHYATRDLLDAASELTHNPFNNPRQVLDLVSQTIARARGCAAGPAGSWAGVSNRCDDLEPGVKAGLIAEFNRRVNALACEVVR